MSNHPEYQRFVPQGSASMAQDAPGWARPCAANDKSDNGPCCWKCRGTGTKGASQECPVCHGCGQLKPKRKQLHAASKPGVITRGRRRPHVGWHSSGPTPFALTNTTTKWTICVETANTGQDVEIKDCEKDMPSWVPRNGEELCNLVGSWRILQRVGSHRWTTDDLVTAHVASQEVPSCTNIKYLDLGTGNASVLQMTTWALQKEGRTVDATGIEARLEAVELARRSLSFNIGNDESVARIVHGDFRDAALTQQFDLVTGTPPYFRVDFAVNDDQVTLAVINQGGMPTAKQSAPARCEFRGGIEAYCEAASRVLMQPHGKFVVCENWLNHNRVVAAAEKYDLDILAQVEVSGKQGRGTLFCVYTMKRKDIESVALTTTKREILAVRNGQGDWTKEYRESVLKAMSIPDPDIKTNENDN